MADLLPKILPTDEIKTSNDYVTTNAGEIKYAIQEVQQQEEAQEGEGSFEGEEDIINEEIKEDLKKEEEEDSGKHCR